MVGAVRARRPRSCTASSSRTARGAQAPDRRVLAQPRHATCESTRAAPRRSPFASADRFRVRGCARWPRSRCPATARGVTSRTPTIRSFPAAARGCARPPRTTTERLIEEGAQIVKSHTAYRPSRPASGASSCASPRTWRRPSTRRHLRGDGARLRDAHHRRGVGERRRARHPGGRARVARQARAAGWKEPANESARSLLPDPGDYRHHRGGEDNGDAHLKNMLVHHQVIAAGDGRPARPRPVAAGLLRRVRRPPVEAARDQGDGRVSGESYRSDGALTQACGQLLQRVGDDVVIGPQSTAFGVDDAGLAQDLQMVGDGGLADLEEGV